MNPNILAFIIVFLLLIIIYLTSKLLKVKKEVKEILFVLEEIEQGNENRKIFTHPKSLFSKICYKVNSIVAKSNQKLINFQEYERAYKNFGTSISHDLRTPITSIIGYIEAISNNIIDEGEKDKYLELVKTKAYNLKNYLNELFDWLRYESKEYIFDFQKVDVVELTRKVLIDWIPIFEKEKFKYEIDLIEEEIYREIDINSYFRIVNNIIQNSLNHSQGTKIRVSIKLENDTIVIKISDNGKGINEKDMPYIFERLYKSDKSRNVQSSGLGLSIVRELVKAHGGKIFVSSEVNKYTLFTIELPVEK